MKNLIFSFILSMVILSCHSNEQVDNGDGEEKYSNTVTNNFPDNVSEVHEQKITKQRLEV